MRCPECNDVGTDRNGAHGGVVMGVKIERPGDPGHPGGNRRTYVRINYQGHRKTRVFNSKDAAEKYAAHVEALLVLGKPEGVFTDPTPPPPTPQPPTFNEIASRWFEVEASRSEEHTSELQSPTN